MSLDNGKKIDKTNELKRNNHLWNHCSQCHFFISRFNNASLVDKYLYNQGRIQFHKEYYRIFSSGFLHANWAHLAFNMITFYSFSQVVMYLVGPMNFIILYLGSLVGGNLLTMFLKRAEPQYRALGASGAVSGVLYAFILPYPNAGINIFFIPIDIPAWIFGILFIGISIFGISKQADNIGHEAHLGGAISGLIIMLIYKPDLIYSQWHIVLLMLVPTLIFLYIMAYKPGLLSIGNKNKWDRWD